MTVDMTLVRNGMNGKNDELQSNLQKGQDKNHLRFANRMYARASESKGWVLKSTDMRRLMVPVEKERKTYPYTFFFFSFLCVLKVPA